MKGERGRERDRGRGEGVDGGIEEVMDRKGEERKRGAWHSASSDESCLAHRVAMATASSSTQRVCVNVSLSVWASERERERERARNSQ